MTTPLTVYAPMRVEAARLRRTLPSGCVHRAGAGRSARRVEAPQGPVAVAGVGGGLSDRVAPGDVVVASEVRTPGATVRCASAPVLANALRRRGLRVHVGPVASRAGLTLGAERARLAAAGVLAADTETYLLLDDAAGVPVACVRVVADAPPVPLADPRTVRALRTALRQLPAVGEALAEWAAACRPGQVLLAAPRSFCAGVERAIDIVERAVRMYEPPVYVRKQIVHNATVVARLAGAGAVFVDELDEVPHGATVVFSAHGVSPAVRAEARRRELHVVDATCPLVAKVHQEARRIERRGGTVLLIGHAGHEEVEGTVGEAPDHTVLVQDTADATRLDLPESAEVSYLVQTTLAEDDVADVVDVLRRRFPRLTGPPSDDICYATTNRQRALRDVAARCDLALVVGSANSSNGNRLVEVAGRAGVPAHLVDGPADVDPRWLAGAATVGVSAAASTPPELVDAVVDALGGLGRTDVAEHRTTTENVRFTLPKEVRTG